MIRKFYFTLAVFIAASWSLARAQQTAKVTPSGIGYLEYLPRGYNSNADKYPLVISLHGIKEKGTASTDPHRVKADLEKVDNVGLPKYVKSGQQYPFILVSPQLKSNYGLWPPSYIMEVLNHVRKYLRVDDRRIYLTGLSLGGFGVWKTAGDYPGVFAAIAPICAGGNALNKAKEIAAANVAVWGFHGGSDKVVSCQVTIKMVNAINAAPKKPHPLAKATIFPGMGHGVWDKAYNQTNLLDWLLSVRKGSAPSLPASGGSSSHETKPSKPKAPPAKKPSSKPSARNSLPIVNAGPDRVLTLPNNSLSIRGQAVDKDGKIVSYRWEKTHGGRATINGASSAAVRISNLDKGIYIFRLRAGDDDGGIKDDYFKITVQPAGREAQKPHTPSASKRGNARPVANAGADRRVTVSQGSVTLKGSGYDRDGKVVSYQWKKLSGPPLKIKGAGTQQVTISGLKEGHYYFSFTVKDNDNVTASDKMLLRVVGG